MFRQSSVLYSCSLKKAGWSLLLLSTLKAPEDLRRLEDPLPELDCLRGWEDRRTGCDTSMPPPFDDVPSKWSCSSRMLSTEAERPRGCCCGWEARRAAGAGGGRGTSLSGSKSAASASSFRERKAAECSPRRLSEEEELLSRGAAAARRGTSMLSKSKSKLFTSSCSLLSAGARRRRPCGLVEPIAGAGAASAADVGVGDLEEDRSAEAATTMKRTPR
ncbi:hypothetical protein TYRP_012932 [Tyrophagus putrescentiae]|nr:hypothetical protein TYRP_012932 [Tyrophagus putrescentiae]